MLGSARLLGLVEVVVLLDLDARLGLSSSAIGLLFAASIAVDAVVSPFGGRWGDRHDRRGRRGPAIVGLGATGVSMLVLAVLPGVGGTAVALGIYGAGFSPHDGGRGAVARRGVPRPRARIRLRVQNLVYAAGYAIGPILGGLLLEARDADLAPTDWPRRRSRRRAHAHDPQPSAPRDDPRRPQAQGRTRARARPPFDCIARGLTAPQQATDAIDSSFVSHPPTPHQRVAGSSRLAQPARGRFGSAVGGVESGSGRAVGHRK